MIINELKKAEYILENGIDESHFTFELSLLAKYYIYQGKKISETRQILLEYCRKNIDWWNEVLHIQKIDNAMLIAKKYRLKVPVDIIITLPEMTSIQSADNKDYQKLLFILLVLAKEEKYNNPNKQSDKLPNDFGYYCNGDLIFDEAVRLAGLKWGIKTKHKARNELYNLGLVNMTLGGAIKILYGANGHPCLAVSNWDNPILDYLKYLGDTRIKKCLECSDLFIKRSNRQMLCPSCYDKHRREVLRENTKKYREKSIQMEI